MIDSLLAFGKISKRLGDVKAYNIGGFGECSKSERVNAKILSDGVTQNSFLHFHLLHQ